MTPSTLTAPFTPGRPQSFDLAGHVVAATAATPAGCELLDRFFSGLTRTESPDTVRISVTAGPLGEGPGTDRVRDADLVVSAHGPARLAHHDSGGAAELRGTDLTVSLAGATGDAWITGRHLLAWGLQLLFNRIGTPIVHAALVSRGRRALAVVGPSGAGKSTLAVAALAGGWTVHGDDMTVLRARSGGVEATTVPRQMMVDADLAAALPEAMARPVPGDPRGRLFLPDVLQTTPFTRLAVVVHVAHHDGVGVVEEYDTDVAALATALGDPHDSTIMRRNLGVAAQFVALPTFVLRHAADPDARIERAQTMLSDIASRADL